MRYWSLLFAVLLVGCKTVTPDVNLVSDVDQKLPSLSPERCVQSADIPVEPPTVSRRFNGDAKHDLEILASNAQALRAWGKEVQRMLEKCASDEIP